MRLAPSIIALIAVYLASNDVNAARHIPTKGSVWPKPAQEWKGHTIFVFKSADFAYETQHHTCDLLERAVERCKDSLNILEAIAKRVREDPSRTSEEHIEEEWKKISRLKINLKEPCEDYPYMGMDESYNLTVSTKSTLTSGSIWGIIRGLETFSQLFYLSEDYKDVLVTATEIEDYPHYPHRGMMVDTSRHYLSVDILLTTLDAMAMNKMNVFHWHIVDDESFPYRSEALPELSEKGAYYPALIYTKNDIRRIVDYARERAIRVVPEFDTPGHVDSWGASHPEILAQCSNSPALNPVKNETYQLLRTLFQEVQALFPDKYFHLGGDEVNFQCWNEDPDTTQYMEDNDIANPTELQKLFTKKVIKLLKTGTVPIVWEEVLFAANAALPTDALVHIWGWDWENKMVNVLSQGHKVLFSSYWYLDYKYWQYEFADFYTGDPRVMVYNKTSNHSLGEGIVGGEACLWGEMVDGNNLVSRMWPRGSAAAEVLWSFTNGTVPPYAWNRIEEHACRMIRRGIQAAPPTGSGFCVDLNNAVTKPDILRESHSRTDSRGWVIAERERNKIRRSLNLIN